MYLSTEPNYKTFKTEINSSINPSKKTQDKSAHIQIQRKNPFWVPSDNTDLFILKDILNEEKIEMKLQKSEQNYTFSQVNK